MEGILALLVSHIVQTVSEYGGYAVLASVIALLVFIACGVIANTDKPKLRGPRQERVRQFCVRASTASAILSLALMVIWFIMFNIANPGMGI